MTYIVQIIFLFRLASNKTFKISYATMNHAIGVRTGSDIFHFVVLEGYYPFL
jgi:hypothetical protein